MPSRFFVHDGQRVRVDVSGQVVRAEMDETATWNERPPVPEPAPSYDETSTSLVPESWPAPLHSSVVKSGIGTDFTPMFALAAKGKAFNDRLYARVEALVHEGVGERVGLYEWVGDLRRAFELGSDMRGYFDVANHLAGGELPEAGRERLLARKWLRKFNEDPLQSEVVGFYTEREWLRKVFLHDRFLQSKLDQQQVGTIRSALEAAPELRALYDAQLALTRALTGPPSTDPDAPQPIFAADAPKYAFLPPSDSPEGRLMRKHFRATPISDGFRIGRELAKRIKSGEVETIPAAADGWYAHRFHANAALLEPETDGLDVGPLYRLELERTFEALFALTRETHVKQLEAVAAGGAPLVVAPNFTVEPLPLYYERVAASYVFIREALGQQLGEDVLRGVSIEEEGPSIFEALIQMQALFEGAAAVSRAELGQDVLASPEGELRQAFFRQWQKSASSDPDLARDLRMAVPVYRDIERRTIRICVTVGMETKTLRLSFVERPTVTALGESISPWGGEPLFMDAKHKILCPITIEADVKRPPNRTEVQKICDEHGTPERIKAALESAVT